MRPSRLEAGRVGGTWIFAWIGLPTGFQRPSRMLIPANDDQSAVDPEIMALTTRLIAACGSEALDEARSRALIAFWAGDMLACRRWNHAARCIDTGLAGRCRVERRSVIRDMGKSLAM